MIKEFTYTELKEIYYSESSHVVGIYLWMYEYCSHYLNEHPEIEMVVLKMIGEDVGKLEGKVFEFKREIKPEDVKLRVIRD